VITIFELFKTNWDLSVTPPQQRASGTPPLQNTRGGKARSPEPPLVNFDQLSERREVKAQVLFPRILTPLETRIVAGERVFAIFYSNIFCTHFFAIFLEK
jgi:hypothetical protein